MREHRRAFVENLKENVPLFLLKTLSTKTGSELVQQNILEAVAWAKETYAVDEKRVYLTGTSGGGHMTLLMAAKYPEVWAAACAFVGISDLAAWHDKHADDQYGDDTRACTGGGPGESEAIDAEYRERSPLTFLSSPKLAELDLPLDILAGVFDGHTGSVPIRQSIDAFNTVASTAVSSQPTHRFLVIVGTILTDCV